LEYESLRASAIIEEVLCEDGGSSNIVGDGISIGRRTDDGFQ
jgi:hypothetical protein